MPLLVTLLIVMGSFGADQHREGVPDPHFNPLDTLGVVLLVVAGLALLFRRRHPVATLAAVGGATLVYYLNAYVYGPAPLASGVALLAAVVSGHRVFAWAGTAVGLIGFFTLASIIGVPGDQRGEGLFAMARPSLGDTTWVLGWTVAVLTVAELVRITGERRTEAEHKRREEELRQASDERLRIARELHDVLAHNISMINVQAGVALHLMDEQPEQARTALATIKEASKEALTEMRSVIGVLRQQGEEAPRSPTAGLARLEELLERARSAGLRVNSELDIPAGASLPAGVDLAAFRIVQESLTNVTRHAGPGPVTAWVRIAYVEDEISVRIDDDGRGAPLLHDHSGGNGLHGMRERVAALGGEFSAGPRPGGGFRVHAIFPVLVQEGVK